MKKFVKRDTRFSKIASILLCLYIIMSMGVVLYQHQNNFLSFNYWQNFDGYKQAFYASPYKTKNFTAMIPDETAYAYVGGALIMGENPIFNLPEVPPLGKYLIGLSAVIFNNPNYFVTLGAGIGGLIMLYLLSRQILGPSFVSLLPIAALVTEPLYKNQYVFVPLFDLTQLFFIISIFYFFNKGLKEKTLLYFTVASIFLGCFIATKFYASGVPIVLSLLTVLVLNSYWMKIFDLAKTLWLSIVILLATYLRVFAFGTAPQDFLGIQKWIFIYWQGSMMLPFTAWDLLLFNRWHTWWDGNKIIPNDQWNIMWPIVTIISLIAIVSYLLRKIPRKTEVEILMAFAVWYGVFMSVGFPSPRYFVVYLPFLYIITIFAVTFLVKNYFKIKS